MGAAAAEVVAGLGRPFEFRPQSNDVNAVVEVFGCQALGKVPAYLSKALDFSPDGHHVLELGGHIGAFAVFAALRGARFVEGYEPHPANAALYRSNTKGLLVKLNEAAVIKADDQEGTETGGGGWHSERRVELALGRDFQGVENTWRHAIKEYSHYAKGNMSLISVEAVPFDAALTEEVTYVKMDCEGAEIEILETVSDWKNVKRLVFEYSFTKRKDMGRFRAIAAQLRKTFPQMDMEDAAREAVQDLSLQDWPWHFDALIFCARD